MIESASMPSPRPIPAAPGYLASALRIFDLSIGEMLWSKRTIFMALIVAAPVCIARQARAGGRADVYGHMVSRELLRLYCS